MTHNHAKPSEVSLAVVVPAHQAASQIDLCLDGLFAAGFAPHEILVVDDGSRDATGKIADARGVRVIRNATPLGPADARNRGVANLNSDIVVFVDADVVIKAGARDRIRATFQDDPTLDALFGSYDDRPTAPRPVSQYRNLLHHFVHQQSSPEAHTFWTGYGAVRREVFLRLGGLDPAWQNIEDVEFGLRLSQAGGRVRLDPTLQATHLKDWTLSGMFRTDLHGRAVPWSRLVLWHNAPLGDLNTGLGHQISVATVFAAPIALLLSVFDARWLVVAVALAALFIAANGRFFGFLARARGPLFAIRAVPYHALHYLAAGLGFGKVLLLDRRAQPRRQPGSAPAG